MLITLLREDSPRSLSRGLPCHDPSPGLALSLPNPTTTEEAVPGEARAQATPYWLVVLGASPDVHLENG